jgi:hypothetical protein
MPRRKEADPRLVKIWEEIGEAIKSGDIDAVFVVWRNVEGLPRFSCGTRTDDIDEMLLEVRSQCLRMRQKSTH